MITYKRGEMLSRLIDKIYGKTTVNFDQSSYKRGQYGEIIINKNGLYDKKSYTLKKRNNFDILFDITFNTTKCVFSGNNRSEETDFNREAAIQNAVAYFQEFGINVTNCLENKNEKKLFSKLIYKLISTELLPVIFNIDDNRKKQAIIGLDVEDITPDFSMAINNVKSVLESKDIVSIMYSNAKMSDIEMIHCKFDKNTKRECDFVTCICTDDIAGIVYEQWSFDPSIVIYIQTKSHKVNSCIDTYFNSPIDYLKKESFLLPYDDKAAFSLPYDVNSQQSSIEGITINLLKNTATAYFLPRYFYYVPDLELDGKDFCREKSSTLLAEGAARVNMRRNAAIALSEKYEADFKKYYENVLDSIIMNTDMLTSVDFEYLLSSNIRKEPKLINAFGTIAIAVNRLYDILSNKYYEEMDIKALIIWLISYSVNLLNNAIEGIIAVPHIYGPGKSSHTNVSRFITQLQKYISKYDIDEFVTKIKSYFDKLQQIQKLFEENHSDVYDKIYEVGAYISIDIKSEYSTTKRNLSEMNFDNTVFKSYRQNLIKLTSILKENNALA